MSGAIDVLADSLLITPGATSKNNIINPNNFPNKLCLSSNISSRWTIIDSFHETFK